MKFKLLKEDWDRRYTDTEEETSYYRGIPIQVIEVEVQAYKGDNWHKRKEYHIMDPKNPTEDHPDLWDEWSYDPDSIKETIDEYLGGNLLEDLNDASKALINFRNKWRDLNNDLEYDLSQIRREYNESSSDLKSLDDPETAKKMALLLSKQTKIYQKYSAEIFEMYKWFNKYSDSLVD